MSACRIPAPRRAAVAGVPRFGACPYYFGDAKSPLLLVCVWRTLMQDARFLLNMWPVVLGAVLVGLAIGLVV